MDSGQVKVSDLPNEAQGQFLYCSRCGAEYSATRSDYFLARPGTVFRCCRRNMLLVRKHTTLDVIR